MNDSEVYDVIIVGAGPAGLAAGLYAGRDRYRTLLVDRSGLPGGQILLTERIENYPGWESISGPDLIEHQRKQVENFGAEIRLGQAVTSLRRRDDGVIEVQLDSGSQTLQTRAVILSPGSDYRRLGAAGEDVMRQAGKVSYCATCDGAFYRDKEVLAVGGGNTAVEDTLYLAEKFVRKVTIIHRRKEFRAQKILVEELYSKAGEHGIDVKLPYVLEEIVPNADSSEIDHIRIRNVETDATEDMKVDGVFIFVGMIPNTGWLKDVVQINDAGYIVCDPITLKTSLPGVFAAGDCRQHAPMQLATACADGVVAAMMIKQYLRNPDSWGQGMDQQTLAW